MKYTFYFFLFLFFSCSTYRLPKTLDEASGIEKMPDGTIWWLEDGQNPAMLYQTDEKARLLQEVSTPFRNRDWEALTYDEGTGTWFVGDFGNNCNCRKDLKIYAWQRGTGNLDSILFSYPDQAHFPPKNRSDWSWDCEAFFFHDNQLHLFSKDRFNGNHFCKYYTLDAGNKQQVAVLQDSFYLKNSVVTDAVFIKKTGEFALLTYWSNLKKPFPKSSGNIFICTFENGKVRKTP